MEIYDITSQQWSLMTSGGQPRYSHSAIFYENKIDVDSARITTLGERVEDNFYVFDRKTESNLSENKCARLQKVLLKL